MVFNNEFDAMECAKEYAPIIQEKNARIAELEAQLAECMAKAEALDWLEQKNVSVRFNRNQGFIAKPNGKMIVGTGATPWEAIQNLREQIETR